jgi:uncharacterized membrane protein YkoI
MSNAFDDALRAWQDGEATREQLAELETALRNDPQCRRRLVGSVLVEASLYSRFSAKKSATPPARRRTWEAAAAVLVFAVSAVAVARLLMKETPGHVWTVGSTSRTVQPGSALDAAGPEPGRLTFKDGSSALLAPGAAGRILAGEAGFELLSGRGDFTIAGDSFRVATPAGQVRCGSAAFSVELGEPLAPGDSRRELVVDVRRGPAEVEAWGFRDALREGVRRTYGPTSAEARNYQRLLDSPALTILEALDRALEKAPGVPIKIKVEEEEGRCLYSIDVVQGRRSMEVDIDVKTGRIETESDDEDHSALVAAAKLTLRDLIARALGEVPGRLIEAELELKGGQPRAEIKILGDGWVRDVYLDAATGTLLKKR